MGAVNVGLGRLKDTMVWCDAPGVATASSPLAALKRGEER